MLTLGSLFDGIGGWLLAAERAGIAPIWASEIDPFPQAVTQQIVAVDVQHIRCAGFVRRLTPLECERLQGLPDNWTLIPGVACPDSKRYKAIGNGMAQPCADFILRRLMRNAEQGE